MASYKDDPEYLNKVGGLAGPRAIKQFENEYTRRQTEYATNPIPMWQYMSPEQRAVAAGSGYGGSGYGGNTPPAAAIPAADYSAFRMTPEEQGRRAAGPAAAKARAEDQAATTRANAYTPAERQMLAISPNPYGTNEPYFDNAGIKRAGYDRMQMNTYDPKVAQGLPGMNPATGIGGSGVSAALRAAAARGDWDAVGRYYASQGQTFGGRMYGDNQDADLYNRAFGSGIRSTKGRERAADFLAKTMEIQAQRDVAAGQQQTLRDVEASRAKTQQDIYGRRGIQEGLYKQAAIMQRDNAARARSVETAMALLADPAKRAGLKPEQLSSYEAFVNENMPWYKSYGSGQQTAAMFGGIDDEFIDGNADGGLIEGYAQGGQVQPVLNPMGNMGMPSSMADLDPAIRQYAQYVSTASQYGLQPVAFPKFIDLLGAARTKLATLPTQGGAVGFAEGGMVDWLKSFLPGVGPLGTPAPAAPPVQTDQQRLGQGAAILGNGMAGQAAQALQGRRSALEEALQAAQGARGGYAMGGAIPVAGQQVLGPGGPKSDSIPAVIDGSRPAALSTGEFVMPTEAVQFFGTDKLNKMVQKARGQ